MRRASCWSRVSSTSSLSPEFRKVLLRSQPPSFPASIIPLHMILSLHIGHDIGIHHTPCRVFISVNALPMCFPSPRCLRRCRWGASWPSVVFPYGFYSVTDWLTSSAVMDWWEEFTWTRWVAKWCWKHGEWSKTWPFAPALTDSCNS